MADVTNASGAAPPASAAAAAASTSNKSLKLRKTVQPAEHPKYREMIASAIITLKERGGSTRHAIMKHILAHYNLGSEINQVKGRVKMSLLAGIKSGSLQRTKGTGASVSSFMLGETVKSAKPQPAKAAGKPGPRKKAKATAVAKKVAAGKKKVAVTAKKSKSATPRKQKLKGKSHKKGALAKKPKAESPVKKGAKPKKVVKKAPTKKQSSSKLAKK